MSTPRLPAPRSSGRTISAAARRVVDGELEPVARAHPDVPPVGREDDVVREEGRLEAPQQPRLGRPGDVDDGDLPGLRPKRDPDGAAGRVDRDVPGERADR